MDSELLKEAIDSLQLKNISLIQSFTELAEDFIPEYYDEIETLTQQTKNFVRNIQRFELSEDNNQVDQILRVVIEFGVRLVEVEEVETVKAEIQARFAAEFLIHKNISDDAIECFSKQNAHFQIWPYWREFLANSCQRLGLPKITLPLRKRAQNCD